MRRGCLPLGLHPHGSEFLPPCPLRRKLPVSNARGINHPGYVGYEPKRLGREWAAKKRAGYFRADDLHHAPHDLREHGRFIRWPVARCGERGRGRRAVSNDCAYAEWRNCIIRRRSGMRRLRPLDHGRVELRRLRSPRTPQLPRDRLRGRIPVLLRLLQSGLGCVRISKRTPEDQMASVHVTPVRIMEADASDDVERGWRHWLCSRSSYRHSPFWSRLHALRCGGRRLR